MNATPRPYKMIGKDGDAFVVCQPDKTGKNRTIAHIYDEDQAYQFVRAVNSFDAMREALEAVAREWERTECPLAQLGPQAPQWIQDVKAALSLAKGEVRS